MALCRNALVQYLSHPTVNVNGAMIPLKTFRSLMYNYNGENYFPLLPYICYLFTFFIFGAPYSFDEGHTEASMHGFLVSLNEYYRQHYAALAADHSIAFDELRGKITDAEWRAFFHKMLDSNEIIRIRNNEMEREPGLLDQCVRSQSLLSQEYITKAFAETMNKLIYQVIQQCSIAKLVKAFPPFDGRYDRRELFHIVAYCLTGGNKSITITDTDEFFPYDYALEQDSQGSSVKSSITPLTMGKYRPFSFSDPLTQICEAYLANEYEKKDTDPFDNSPSIGLLETNIVKEEEQLRSFFTHGIFLLYKSAIGVDGAPAFFRDTGELDDIIALPTALQLAYGSTYATTCLPTYIHSLLPQMLLQHCNARLPLTEFSLFRAVFLMPSIDIPRCRKLINVANALTMVHNPTFVSFINRCITDFLTIMHSNPIILQVYVKHIDDSADALSIGGCDVYTYGNMPNSFLRAYGFIRSVLGNSEDLTTFARWCEGLDNQALFDIVDTCAAKISPINTAIVETGLQNALSSLRIPMLLSNFSFSTGNSGPTYAYRPVNYFYTHELLQFVMQYIFPVNNLRNAQTPTLITRSISFQTNGNAIAGKPAKNSYVATPNASSNEIGKLFPIIMGTGRYFKIPVYNHTGAMDDISLLFSNPPSYALRELVIPSTRSLMNHTIFLFYRESLVQSRYTRYTAQDADPGNKAPYYTGELLSRSVPDKRRTTHT
jgi:hypothetical protein